MSASAILIMLLLGDAASLLHNYIDLEKLYLDLKSFSQYDIHIPCENTNAQSADFFFFMKMIQMKNTPASSV